MGRAIAIAHGKSGCLSMVLILPGIIKEMKKIKKRKSFAEFGKQLSGLITRQEFVKDLLKQGFMPYEILRILRREENWTDEEIKEILPVFEEHIPKKNKAKEIKEEKKEKKMPSTPSNPYSGIENA